MFSQALAQAKDAVTTATDKVQTVANGIDAYDAIGIAAGLVAVYLAWRFIVKPIWNGVRT